MKVLRNTSPLFNNYLVEMGPWDVQVLTLLAKPAPGKPAPSNHEPPRKWDQAPVTLIYQRKNKRGGGMGVKE